MGRLVAKGGGTLMMSMTTSSVENVFDFLIVLLIFFDV